VVSFSNETPSNSARWITITCTNSDFVRDFAESHGLAALCALRCALCTATSRFRRSSDSPLAALWLHAHGSVATVLGGFGFWSKFLFTFWDLFGCLVALVCLLNLTLSLCTMGLYRVADHDAVYAFVLLQFAGFTLTFGGLFAIPALEFFEFRLLRVKYTSFFFAHQRLLLGLLRVLPCGVARGRPFSCGALHDFAFGVLFFVFGLCVLEFAPTASVEEFVLVIVLGILPAKYLTLYLLYALHSFA
jgi:hypothetical protein